MSLSTEDTALEGSLLDDLSVMLTALLGIAAIVGIAIASRRYGHASALHTASEEAEQLKRQPRVFTAEECVCACCVARFQ